MLGAIFGLSILGFLIGVENRYLTLIQLFWYVFKKKIIMQVGVQR